MNFTGFITNIIQQLQINNKQSLKKKNYYNSKTHINYLDHFKLCEYY